MILFKASGSTYGRVAAQAMHAFPFAPADVRVGEFVLLSKNREDCAPTERQIQHVAKLLTVRPAAPAELESWFPGVDAGKRWGVLAEMYWSRKLDRPFNLSAALGLKAQRYDSVQEFARLDDEHERAVANFLFRHNDRVVLDFLNNAEPPEAGSRLGPGAG